MILALSLYLKLPFGKMHKGNPEVIALASKIGRTPNSVALRLVNYAACDPVLRERQVTGMAHGGRKCMEYWDEFSSDRDKLLFESERILAEYEGTSISEKYNVNAWELPEGLEGTERTQAVKTRVNQCVFRQIVLANYGGRCALTGIDIPELLVASHIIPWAEEPRERLNPQNGICLSSLYDKAFDKGLIGFDNQLRVIFSERLACNCEKEYYKEYFSSIENKKLESPLKYPVNHAFIEWHRNHVFIR